MVPPQWPASREKMGGVEKPGRFGAMTIGKEAVMEFNQVPPINRAIWEGGWPQTPGEFERLVEAFQDRLVRYAFRRLGNLHDAEDVAQEVFSARLCRSRAAQEGGSCERVPLSHGDEPVHRSVAQAQTSGSFA